MRWRAGLTASVLAGEKVKTVGPWKNGDLAFVGGAASASRKFQPLASAVFVAVGKGVAEGERAWFSRLC